jgi:hypothetical protein
VLMFSVRCDGEAALSLANSRVRRGSRMSLALFCGDVTSARISDRVRGMMKTRPSAEKITTPAS